MEHCVHICLPLYRKDVIALKKMKKRFTRMLLEVKSLSYEERLDRLGLFSLELRRMRGDLIKVFKIMRGIDRVDHEKIFLWQPCLRPEGVHYIDDCIGATSCSHEELEQFIHF
eukprot:g44181.t1